MSDIPDRLRSKVFFKCYASEFPLEDSLEYQAAAEIEWLEELVKSAFYEGVNTKWIAGPNSIKSIYEIWDESFARRALSEDKA